MSEHAMADGPARSWGWAVFVRSLRSEHSWGTGDLRDLGAFARWADGTGARHLFLGPTGALGGGAPIDPSPYAPSSRCFEDTTLIHVPWVDGWERLGPGVRAAADAARAALDTDVVDLDAVVALKARLLRRLFDEQVQRGCLDQVLRARRQARDGLRLFAVHQTAEAAFGPEWTAWPEPLRRPDTAADSAFAREQAPTIAFHEWCQAEIDRQFRAVGCGCMDVVRELPVGTPLHSADAWTWQHMIERRAELGAPADYFCADGHRWGLVPFDPAAFAASACEPLRRAVAAALRHGTGVKIDHALGLVRQYWIPTGAPAACGTYVEQPTGAIVGTIAACTDPTTLVVTEELGTPPARGLPDLRAAAFLPLAVSMSDQDPPATGDVVATATTHDLPTTAGCWTGTDERALHDAGIAVDPAVAARQRRTLAATTALPCGAPVERVLPALYGALAASEARLVVVPVHDALGLDRRPNVPGTTAAQWPNFVQRLPPLDRVETSPMVQRVVSAVTRERS